MTRHFTINVKNIRLHQLQHTRNKFKSHAFDAQICIQNSALAPKDDVFAGKEKKKKKKRKGVVGYYIANVRKAKREPQIAKEDKCSERC
jgi:hypothetical protein